MLLLMIVQSSSMHRIQGLTSPTYNMTLHPTFPLHFVCYLIPEVVLRLLLLLLLLLA
jgi:hypothetical protein